MRKVGSHEWQMEALFLESLQWAHRQKHSVKHIEGAGDGGQVGNNMVYNH